MKHTRARMIALISIGSSPKAFHPGEGADNKPLNYPLVNWIGSSAKEESASSSSTRAISQNRSTSKRFDI